MKKKIFLKRFFGALVCLYLLTIAGIYALQKYIIFQPDSLEKDFQYSFDHSFEEFFLETSDGEQLNALLFQTQLDRKGLVLYFHGNADNLTRWAKFHSDFTSRGYDFFIPEYRGFGKSSGKPSEEDFYRDAKFVYDWILKKYPGEEIIIYGRSLGAAVASNLATKISSKLVVLETPFDNVNNLLQTQARGLILPFDFKYDFPNDEHLQKIKQPVYIFEGTKDFVVPNASTNQLKALLKPSDEFIVIEGGGHRNLSKFEKYQQALDSIL